MNETENLRGLKLVLGVYFVIFGMKLIGYLLTGGWL